MASMTEDDLKAPRPCDSADSRACSAAVVYWLALHFDRDEYDRRDNDPDPSPGSGWRVIVAVALWLLAGWWLGVLLR